VTELCWSGRQPEIRTCPQIDDPLPNTSVTLPATVLGVRPAVSASGAIRRKSVLAAPGSRLRMDSDLSQLGFLLFVSALVAMLMQRLRMPYTVGLVLAGMALYFLHISIKWHLSKDLIFSVFLPPLVFEAALFIDWREFKKDLPVLSLLATVGMLLAAAVTALGMHYILRWDWGSAIIFGVLIAATDPVSVIASFKTSGVKGRVRLLLEAESLLNDGTAAVAFVVVLGVLAGDHVNLASIAGTLIITIAGSILIGGVVACGFMFLAGRTPDYLVEITFTTLAAYGSFFLGERFHCSGVLAALTAGLVVSNFRSSALVVDANSLAPQSFLEYAAFIGDSLLLFVAGAKRAPYNAALSGLMTETGRRALVPFWEYLAFVANSLIFLLIGAQEAQQRFGNIWWPVLVAIIVVTAGRAIAIYPLCAVFSKGRLKVDHRHQHALFWGGLRGALALALALALPQTIPQHDLIVTLTFAVVAFSIFVQGLTITPLLRRLGLFASTR
jgi:monovalent cation:H+ antiporter, CPA1 family